MRLKLGTTSACAENTHQGRIPDTITSNYLRMRGEYFRAWLAR